MRHWTRRCGRMGWWLGVAACAGGALGQAGGSGGDLSDYAFLDPLIDVKVLLEEHYVESPVDAAMRDAAIRAMVEALDDPYTVYVPARATAEFSKGLSGRYVGIGAQVTERDGWLTIVTPLEGSPALRAGVMAGDRVLEIDGVSTFGKSSDECVELLQGEPGTEVELLIERGGQRETVRVARAEIQARAVRGFHRAGEGWNFLIDPRRRVGYIRLSQFTPESAEEVAAALEALGAARGELGGLVLDLRWNPGGLLDAAGDIADMLLDAGVIVSTRGRTHPEEVRRATSEGTLPEFPVAVLINGGSASASEVLAGALQDNGRAIVVGTRSFGKGSVQSVRALPRGGGAQLKVTEQRYYLPSGRSIQRLPESAEWGVDPDEGFWVEATPEQVRALMEVRRAEEVIGGGAGAGVDWSDPEAALEYLADPQLSAAVRAVQGRVDTGRWEATGGAGPGGAALAAEELARLRLTRERLERELSRLDARLESLAMASEGAAAPALRDLWADDAAIEGGTLRVIGADGALVRELRITGPDLERWLIDADVEPAE